jgi:hypothetical protein
MKDKKTAYTLKEIDPELWRRVRAAAMLEGLTAGAWILKLLEKTLPAKKGGRS